MTTIERKAEVVLKLREFRQSLFAMVESRPESETSRPIFDLDGEPTSIKQELDRIRRMETTYRRWAMRALVDWDPEATDEGDDAVGPPPPEVSDRPLAEILDGLRAERRRTLAFIADLEPEQFESSIRTPFGVLTVDEILGMLYRHDRELTRAMLGHESYLPRFLVGEPVPRRRHA